MTSEDASRPGRHLWDSGKLPMEITLKRIACRYNNLVSKVIFKQYRYLIATPRISHISSLGETLNFVQ
jgi:hypothetical protein